MSGANWFSEALKDAVKSSGLNVTKFSEQVGIPRETFVGWMDGATKPDVLKAGDILKKVGWNLDRARPDWEPEIVSEPEEPIIGRIAAGVLSYLDADDVEYVRMSHSQWRSAALWDMTTRVKTEKHGVRDFILARISGDSMEPDYKHNEIVVCRAPKDVNFLQDGTPCIFRDEDGETFKILRWARSGKIRDIPVGEPINKEHQTIIFGPGSGVEIRYVVIGTQNMGASPRMASKKNNILHLPAGVTKGFPKK